MLECALAVKRMSSIGDLSSRMSEANQNLYLTVTSTQAAVNVANGHEIKQ